MLATHSANQPVLPAPKRAFMSKENRLYSCSQDGQPGGNKRLRPNSGNGRYKFVDPPLEMFITSAWAEGRENTAVNRSPRLKTPLVRTTPLSLWQITPKENTDPRVEFGPIKKSGPVLDPIGSERRQFTSNASVSRKNNVKVDSKSTSKLSESDRNESSFTWAGAGPESNMDLLTSPLSVMNPVQEDVVRPLKLTKPLRPALGPYRHSFSKSPPLLHSSYSPNSNLHSNLNSSFSASYAYPSCLSVPTADLAIDSEPIESPPLMTITQFATALREVRKRNPYAPKMPSMLNPLRASAPSMYHNYVEPNTRNPYSNLTWNLQRRRVVVMRSRSRCTESNRSLRPITYICNGDTHHCVMCKRDNLCKRLLTSRYWRLQDQAQAQAEAARMEMEKQRQQRLGIMEQSVPRDVGESEDEDEDELEADFDGDVRMRSTTGGALRLDLRRVNSSKRHEIDMDMNMEDVLDITGSLAQELKHYARSFDVSVSSSDDVGIAELGNGDFGIHMGDRRDRVVGRVGNAGQQSISFLLPVPDRRDSSHDMRDLPEPMSVGDWIPDSPVLKDLDSFPDEHDQDDQDELLV